MLGLLKMNTGKKINVNELDNLIGDIDLIDVRETYEFKNQSIKSAQNIPMGQLVSDPNKYLAKDNTYYLICESGARSARTCNYLTKQGFDVINVLGGVSSYDGKYKS
ncbi:MAG: rhodanese domain protein [Anaerocolumna sp.]|jgi:rhodanese-related sulfurtransferase|nr:rhodanese domain protein [Anaerocolumna sp.]